ncbi:MAG: bifunctional 3-deoxy-7-phosphoheptulonate synthase/chorismate mutase type II, partial [Flavobacteriales bacterium]|nr:bifunctional 3-deoxy-7-phosphoheptulonate synthase/chorismate mutase type II [Flavobacteriales bacterium]
CSAESEFQVLEVAEKLASGGRVKLMRAGIWKPRTRPNSFEGVGSQGLKWLMKAEQEFGIPAIVEVVNKSHVQEALDAGLRHFWIGARTTVNPFLVEELANALEASNAPVFVKNPMNPDLDLWIGALERFAAHGLDKLVAVHRGFNTYQDHVYRNSPNWEIPIELKTRYPNLDIIVDPSHIGGQRELLHPIAQKAFDLGFDGLMIETHPSPDKALSDPKQQIELANFDDFLGSLEIKSQHFEDSVTQSQLRRLRVLIDEIDHNLLENLKHRLKIVEQIGEYKADHGVMVFQLERWKEIMDDRLEYGSLNEIDQKLIKTVWNDIHNASIRLQTEIVKHNLTPKD